MFLHLSVILFTGGVGFPACMTGHMTRGGYASGGLNGGICMGWSASKKVCLHAGVFLPRVRRVCIQGVWADLPPPRSAYKGAGSATPLPPDTWNTTGYGHQAGGTYPTGMHSCFSYCFRSPEEEWPRDWWWSRPTHGKSREEWWRGIPVAYQYKFEI